ncbi:MAG: sodium:solute symporter family protein [candidate division KSB1 bacterium]|nr:sodium:solute symporter family protein [candidate division KSB1 bacterium]
MLAGSNLGIILGFLTFSAALFSAFTFQGMPDFFRQHGIGAWIFLAFSDGVMVFFILWFGLMIRKKAKKLGFKGVAGLTSNSYGTPWAGYAMFASAFIFLIPYAAIQVRGISVFFDAAFPDFLPYWGWALILVILMILYSEIGGFKAIVYSDAIQGTILLVVLWLISVTCIVKLGGLGEMMQQVRDINPELLSIPGPNGLFTPQFLIASMIAVVMIPVSQPHMTTRLVVMRNLKSLKTMTVAVGLFAVVIILATVFIGFYGAVQYPGASAQKFWANALLYDQLAPVAGLAVVGLFAACLSTTNAQIFALGNELRSLLSGSEKRVMHQTKLALFVFAMLVLVFSAIMGDQLALLARVKFYRHVDVGADRIVCGDTEKAGQRDHCCFCRRFFCFFRFYCGNCAV